MKILFVHQNFPGQFKYLAPSLVEQGHDVVALTLRQYPETHLFGVKIFKYSISRGTTVNAHPWTHDFESKIIRGEGAFKAARDLNNNGFYPDIIISHPGWGESLFLKTIWPRAKVGVFCEFYYHTEGADVGFDPEFSSSDPEDNCRVILKNANNLLHLESADAGLAPTHWQASTYPAWFRDKITVIHDGIDSEIMAPNPGSKLNINGLELDKNAEIITFVNRNLEPYRGYHIFMRALPDILKRRKNVKILIVGGDDVSYGARPKGGGGWKDIFIKEIRPKVSDNDWTRIYFLGNIPYQQFIALLQISTVHVYWTYPFVLSWSLLEAMSIGCAIVASDTQPLYEAIKHNETGRLVPFFDVAGMANEVCALLDSPEERARLGANARGLVKQTYDLKTVCLPKQIEWVESLGMGE